MIECKGQTEQQLSHGPNIWKVGEGKEEHMEHIKGQTVTLSD